jgi:hypothetical protein
MLAEKPTAGKRFTAVMNRVDKDFCKSSSGALPAWTEQMARLKSTSFIGLLISCLVGGICYSSAFAQSYQGSLRGSLRDSSGNVLPSATLTLTNEATNVSRIVITN